MGKNKSSTGEKMARIQREQPGDSGGSGRDLMRRKTLFRREEKALFGGTTTGRGGTWRSFLSYEPPIPRLRGRKKETNGRRPRQNKRQPGRDGQ
jgi:hypothetical protein